MEEYREGGSPPRVWRRRSRSRSSDSGSDSSLQLHRRRTGRRKRSRSRRRRRRSSSRSRRRGHARRRSTISSSSSSSSSYSRSYSSSDGRGRRRSSSRRRHRGSGRGAAALLGAEPFCVRAGGGAERPEADWVCGVCSNLNSVSREECFRCGTSYSLSARATPTEEIKISDVPGECTFADIQKALEDRFAEHSDACHIVAHVMERSKKRRGGDDGGGAEEEKWVAYALFDSIAEATKALTYARSLLVVGQSVCAMEFSSHKRVNRGQTLGAGCGKSVKMTDSNHVEGLPDALQPGAWKRVENFATQEEEKEYLVLMSKHWDKLSQPQKDYYDECVHRALAAQRKKQEETNSAKGSNATSAPTGTSITTTTTTNLRSSLDNLRKKLEVKEQAQQGKNNNTTTTNSSGAPAVSIREKLAMKKAQLSSTTNPSKAATNTDMTPAAPSSSSAPALTTQKDSTPAPASVFYGFPIPSRFPTKTDYLKNTKSPSLRAGLMLRYVPPTVAERILPPATRPPPSNTNNHEHTIRNSNQPTQQKR